MSWQRSVQAAVRSLRGEQRGLERQLAAVQKKIRELEELGSSGPVRKKRAKHRLSAQGRANISRAAKRRWAKYRAEQRKRDQS
jgi:hypothetical protein